MLKSCCLTILAAAFAMAAPLFAQSADGPIKMTPEFPLTFPFAMKDGSVTVKFPVLINPSTVLKPGMILRTLYVIQETDDSGGSSDLNIAHADDQAAAYARSNEGTDNQPKMPYALAHELEGYRRTVWPTPTNFELAMAQFPTDLMHLIYEKKVNDRELVDQRFNFFDGMLVGQPDGSSVVVLAVENDSKADQAGIKAGDEIMAVGGASTQHDLTAFATAFANARHDARETDASSYSLTLRSAGQSATHTAAIAMPPTIKSQLLNGL
jgi:hypothetical protein